MLTKPSRDTAADQVASVLFEAIMDGSIRPGAPLRLQRIADQMGMSMMPVREGLRRLELFGLIEIIPHKGAWVKPLTHDDLIDTYFTRLHLETLALREAAVRFTDDDAERAANALDEQAAARRRGDQVAARHAHERFHFTMYEASGSIWLVRSILPAWRNSERYRVESMRDRQHVKLRAAEHHQMLDALKSHDPDRAVSLLTSHLRSSVEFVARNLDEASGSLTLPDVDDLLVLRRPAAERTPKR